MDQECDDYTDLDRRRPRLPSLTTVAGVAILLVLFLAVIFALWVLPALEWKGIQH
jgi:hypothetical protein